MQDQYQPVIRNLNLSLPSGKSLALLGRNGAGKSTLLKIVAGTMRPDTGQIRSDRTISFTVGYSGGFHGEMTGEQNTRFVARVYGVDSDELCAFVEDFAEIGKHFKMPVRTYSSGMNARLAFGVSMGIPFGVYLIDEVTATGDARFKRKSEILFKQRMTHSSAIMVSHNMRDIEKFCDAGLILNNGEIEVYDNVDDAIKRHKELLF